MKQKHIFKKKFGQNFLQDENILEKIYNSVSPTKDDLIIEIGPGSGNLTKWLKKYNSNLICIEIDESLKETLSKYEDDKTKIIFKDFMEMDLSEELKNYNYQKLYVIANIPYYITTPIIEKITFSNIPVEKIVLMIQKEVAERLSSKPQNKEYGYITVLLNYFFEIKNLFSVSRNCFYPVPNVDSAVISLTTKTKEEINIESFQNLIKNAFKFKRKTLKNNLNNYDLHKIENVLKKHNYSLNNRAEEIPLEVYIAITKEINNKY